MTDFEEQVTERQAELTGPWKTRRIGPLVYRTRMRPDWNLVAADMKADEVLELLRRSRLGRWLLLR